MWYEFNTFQEFEDWHYALCQILGIPDEVTIAYTESFEIENKWIAIVEDKYAENLVLTELRPALVIVA